MHGWLLYRRKEPYTDTDARALVDPESTFTAIASGHGKAPKQPFGPVGESNDQQLCNR
jgi:hypothetical protein